jgi:hypothetical protein
MSEGGRHSVDAKQTSAPYLSRSLIALKAYKTARWQKPVGTSGLDGLRLPRVTRSCKFLHIIFVIALKIVRGIWGGSGEARGEWRRKVISAEKL